MESRNHKTGEKPKTQKSRKTKSMKKIFNSITLLFMFVSTICFSQEKTSVGILEFTYAKDGVEKEYVNSVQESVTNAFVKTRRFNIVDRTKMQQVQDEKNRQKSEDFIDGKVVEQGKSVGATYLVSGHIISAHAEEMKTDDGKGKITIDYKSKLMISLKIIDVATGGLVASETIEPKSGSSVVEFFNIGSSTPSSAMAKAIKKIEDKVDEFVGKNFPTYFSIAEIQKKNSNGAASEVLIAGGSGFGLKKGDRLKVAEIVEVTVNGNKTTRKKEIGELKVTKVEDENFSICSVIEGGEIIGVRFESNAKLQIITK